MGLFDLKLKLYYKQDRDGIDLSFFISPHYVLTFYLTRIEFEQIIDLTRKKIPYERPGLLVIRKAQHLRWSFDAPGMTHQIRTEIEKWNLLVDSYQSQMKSSIAPIVTCIVE